MHDAAAASATSGGAPTSRESEVPLVHLLPCGCLPPQPAYANESAEYLAWIRAMPNDPCLHVIAKASLAGRPLSGPPCSSPACEHSKWDTAERIEQVKQCYAWGGPYRLVFERAIGKELGHAKVNKATTRTDTKERHIKWCSGAVALALKGCSNKAIAEHLEISPRHLSRLDFVTPLGAEKGEKLVAVLKRYRAVAKAESAAAMAVEDTDDGASRTAARRRVNRSHGERDEDSDD
jgi:hypothetical protein